MAFSCFLKAKVVEKNLDNHLKILSIHGWIMLVERCLIGRWKNRVKMFRPAENPAMENADTISDIRDGGLLEAYRATLFRETNVDKKKSCETLGRH